MTGIGKLDSSKVEILGWSNNSTVAEHLPCVSPSNSFSPVLFKNDIDVIGISSWRKYVKCEFSIGIIFGSSTTSVFPFFGKKEELCDFGVEMWCWRVCVECRPELIWELYCNRLILSSAIMIVGALHEVGEEREDGLKKVYHLFYPTGFLKEVCGKYITDDNLLSVISYISSATWSCHQTASKVHLLYMSWGVIPATCFLEKLWNPG